MFRNRTINVKIKKRAKIKPEKHLIKDRIKTTITIKKNRSIK